MLSLKKYNRDVTAITNMFLIKQEHQVPTGSVTQFAGTNAPDGWLMCDGSAKSISDYPKLADIIGTTYGTAPTGSFKLPDFRGRVPIAPQIGLNLTTYTMGTKSGSETHTLSVAEMPAHKHDFKTLNNDYITTNDPAYPNTGSNSGYMSAPPYDAGNLKTWTESVQNEGGGQAHNIMQPYLVINYIIKWY